MSRKKKSFYAGMKDIEQSTIAKCTSLNPIIETNSFEQFTMDITDNSEHVYQILTLLVRDQKT